MLTQYINKKKQINHQPIKIPIIRTSINFQALAQRIFKTMIIKQLFKFNNITIQKIKSPVIGICLLLNLFLNQKLNLTLILTVKTLHFYLKSKAIINSPIKQLL